MAAHTRGPRKRTRKPRASAPAQRPSASVDATGAQDQPRTARDVQAARMARIAAGKTHGERPPAPWHPLPLSELLIFAGGTAVAVAVLGRLPNAGVLVLVGMGAVALGTVEVSWREHRCGYRSHALLLAVLPVIVLHTAVVLAVGAFTTPPRALTVGFLAVDAALVWFLLRALRLGFSQARLDRG